MFQIFEWKSQWINQLMEFQSFNDLSNTFHLSHHALHKKNSEIVWKEINTQIYPNFDPESKEFKNIIKQEIQYQKGIKLEAQQSSIQQLVNRYKNKFHIQKRFQKLITIKLQQGEDISAYRKDIWLIASNAQYYMNDIYKGYYDKLKFSNFPDFFRFTILKDVDRTFLSKGSSQQMFQSLYNLLMVYSRRNAKVGYCQGMNFIASFLLQQSFNEEESFWIMANLLEEILPLDYYTNMTGAVIDKCAFQDILEAYNPQVSNKLSDLELDLTIFCTIWFVCLFTNTLSYPIVQIVWDNLLLEGTIVLIKVGLVILDICEQEILQATNFADVLIIVEKICKNINDQKDFQKRISSIYLNKQILQVIKELNRFKQLAIDKDSKRKRQNKRDQKFQVEIDKTMEKILNRTECLPYWPICHHLLQSLKPKHKKSGMDFFIFKQQKDITPDYSYFKNVNQFNSRFSQSSLRSNNTKKIVYNNQSGGSRNQNQDVIKNMKRNFDISRSNISSQEDPGVGIPTDEETQLQNSSYFNSSQEHQNSQSNKNLQNILIERQKHICIDFQRTKLRSQNDQRNSFSENMSNQKKVQKISPIKVNQQEVSEEQQNGKQDKIDTINPLEMRKKYQQSRNMRRQTKSIGQKEFEKEFKFDLVYLEKQKEKQKSEKSANLFKLQNNQNDIKLDPYKTLNQEIEEQQFKQTKTLPKSNTYLYLEDKGQLVDKQLYMQQQKQKRQDKLSDISSQNLNNSNSKINKDLQNSQLKEEIQNDLEILKEYARQIKEKMSQSNSIMFIKNLPINKSKRIIGYEGFGMDHTEQGEMSNTSSTRKNFILEDDLNQFKQELQEGQTHSQKEVIIDHGIDFYNENNSNNNNYNNYKNDNEMNYSGSKDLSIKLNRINSDNINYSDSRQGSQKKYDFANNEYDFSNSKQQVYKKNPNIVINEARMESENDISEGTGKSNSNGKNFLSGQKSENYNLNDDFIKENYVVQEKKNKEDDDKFLKVNSRNLIKMLSFQNLLSSNANSRQFLSPMVPNLNSNTLQNSPDNIKSEHQVVQSCTIKKENNNLMDISHMSSNKNLMNNKASQQDLLNNTMNISNQSKNQGKNWNKLSHQHLLQLQNQQNQQQTGNLSQSSKKKNMLSMQMLNGFTIGNYQLNQFKQSYKQLNINQDLLSQNLNQSKKYDDQSSQQDNLDFLQNENMCVNQRVVKMQSDNQQSQREENLNRINLDQKQDSFFKNNLQNNKKNSYIQVEEVNSSTNFVKFINGKNSIQFFDIEQNSSTQN